MTASHGSFAMRMQAVRMMGHHRLHVALHALRIVALCPAAPPRLGHARHPRVHVVEAAKWVGNVLAQAVEQYRIDGVAVTVLQALRDGLRRGAMAAASVGIVKEEA